MSEEKRFRFGRFGGSQDSNPTPRAVEREINRLGNRYIPRDWTQYMQNEEPLRLEEKGANPSVHELDDGTEYCYFIYLTDTTQSALFKRGGGEEEDILQTLIRVRVFYFENGQIAFENNNKLKQNWLPHFINKVTDTKNASGATFRDLPQEVMRDFYADQDQVSLLRLAPPEDDPHPWYDMTYTAQRSTSVESNGSQTTKSSSEDPDLSGNPSIDQDVDNQFVKEVHGTVDDGLKHEIRASGSVMLNWGKNEWPNNEDDRRSKIEDKIVPYLKALDESDGSS